MRYLILLTFLLSGCSLFKKDPNVIPINVNIVATDIKCGKTEPIELSTLDENKYIAEKENIKKLIDNYILMNDYNKRLYAENACYIESMKKIKEDSKK